MAASMEHGAHSKGSDSSSWSDSSDDDTAPNETLQRFQDAAVTADYISNLCHGKKTSGNTRASNQSKTSLPSKRCVEVNDHEDENVLRTTPEFRAFVARKLSEKLDREIEFCTTETPDSEYVAWFKPPIDQGVYLCSDSVSVLNVDDDDEEALSQPQKTQKPHRHHHHHRRSRISEPEGDEAERLAAVAVTADFLAQERAMWARLAQGSQAAASTAATTSSAAAASSAAASALTTSSSTSSAAENASSDKSQHPEKKKKKKGKKKAKDKDRKDGMEQQQLDDDAGEKKTGKKKREEEKNSTERETETSRTKKKKNMQEVMEDKAGSDSSATTTNGIAESCSEKTTNHCMKKKKKRKRKDVLPHECVSENGAEIKHFKSNKDQMCEDTAVKKRKKKHKDSDENCTSVQSVIDTVNENGGEAPKKKKKKKK